MDFIIPSLRSIVIIIVLFLVFRAVILWYWRISDAANSLKNIANSLKQIAENTRKETKEEKGKNNQPQ